jgi:hypothetical protein
MISEKAPGKPRSWLAKMREGWGLVWAWTVLNALGMVAAGAAVPDLFHDWPIEDRVLVWVVLAYWAAAQAWLLALRCSGQLMWTFGWALALTVPIDNLTLFVLAALAVTLLVQAAAIHTSRQNAPLWFVLNWILFLTCCAGALGSFLLRESFINEVPLPTVAREFVANDATIGIGWAFLFLFVQGMIAAFMIPPREA